jgi:hypothetical protein
MTDETRMRFLAGIAAQVPAERVAEVHLFGAIRQGGQESGVAVIAVRPEEPHADDVEMAQEVDVEPEVGMEHEVHSSPEPDEEGPETDADVSADEEADGEADVDTRPTRYTVYTARFRHTLKGPERGKWELTVTEEADAPLLTVDAVERGVSRRSGETDETIRLSGDEFRAALPEPARA